MSNPAQLAAHAIIESQIQRMPPLYDLPDTLAGYGGELHSAWEDRARYLIVTTRQLAPSFKRLAALKRQKGYSVQIKCIEDILADPRVQNGDTYFKDGMQVSAINDDAGKLRQYLKLARCHDNTQFVLMGGTDVPYRFAAEWGKKIPTDQYFVDLSTQWIPSDQITDSYKPYRFDLLPELYVGRLLGRSGEWNENYIDKLLRYELNPGRGDFSYLRRALSFEKSNSNGYSDSIIGNLQGVFAQTDLRRERTKAPFNTGEELVSLMNTTRYGFVDIFSHGSPNGMAVCMGSNPCSSVRALQRQNNSRDPWNWSDGEMNGLDNLNNKYYPFVLYTSSCVTMPFDIYEEGGHIMM